MNLAYFATGLVGLAIGSVLAYRSVVNNTAAATAAALTSTTSP